MSSGGITNTFMYKNLDWKKAALMSTEGSLKPLLAATAVSNLKLSLDAVGLSDGGFRDSWN